MKLQQKVGSLYAVLRANWLGRRQAISCQYAVTNRCPWRCSYCSIEKANQEECSPEEALRIVDECAAAGVYRLHLVGGEPMLREDIGDVAGRAKELGLYVTMATSGIRIPQMIDRLRGVDLFLLSFDGPEEVHDRQRGRGSSRVLREAMASLREGGKEFWTTTVVTRHNINHLDYILEEGRSRGFVCNFHLLYADPVERIRSGYIHPEKDIRDLRPSREEYRQALRHLIAKKKGDYWATIGDSLAYLELLLSWEDPAIAYRPEASERYTCWAGKLFAYIDSNGDLYPCCDVIGRLEPPNVLRTGLVKALRMLPPPPCRSCIVACYAEMNLMFSLKLGAILNWVKRV